MNFVYPKFSKHDFMWVRLGGAGLGNLLFTYSRALIFAHQNDYEFIWPTWPSVKIGTFLRHEKDKRFYNDLFKNNSKYIAGIKKPKILLGCDKVYENDYDSEKKYDNVVFVFNKYVMDFESLLPYRDLIYNDLIKNLHPKNKEVLCFDCSDSINIHIRLGDFSVSSEKKLQSGCDNMRLPINWYVEIIEKIRKALGRNIRFNVFSDGTDEELAPVISLDNVRRVTFGTSIADIIALSRSKIIIASGSTFSMWARFLGGTSAISFSNQLKCRKLCGDNGFELEVGMGIPFSEDTVKKLKEAYPIS